MTDDEMELVANHMKNVAYLAFLQGYWTGAHPLDGETAGDGKREAAVYAGSNFDVDTVREELEERASDPTYGYPDWPNAERRPDATLPLSLTRRGIAPANIYGQLLGFTHKDVEYLRYVADPTVPNPDDPEWYRSLIARITALLPPEAL